MPGGKGKLRPEDNPKPWVKGQSGNPKGQPPSIRNQLREILVMDGKMHIKPEHVISQNDDGSVDILMPKKDMVAMKLMQWAMSSKEGASVRSIQLIMETLDGRAHQSVSVSTDQPINQIELSDAQVEKILEEMKPKQSEEGG